MDGVLVRSWWSSVQAAGHSPQLDYVNNLERAAIVWLASVETAAMPWLQVIGGVATIAGIILGTLVVAWVLIDSIKRQYRLLHNKITRENMRQLSREFNDAYWWIEKAEHRQVFKVLSETFATGFGVDGEQMRRELKKVQQ